MAATSAVFSSFLSVDTAPFRSKSSPSSLRFVPATLHTARTVTCATPASSKPATGKREPRGISKPRRVSPDMQEFVGVPEIPRTQALKLIWAHIKLHNLQDPQNKKVIICDEKLKTIFDGRDTVGFLEIAGLIGRHFL